MKRGRRPGTRSVEGTGGSGEGVRRGWPAVVLAAAEVQTPQDVHRARWRARSVARRCGADDEHAGLFELVVHEVCANAVEHADGGYFGLWFDAGQLVCEVVDGGPGIGEADPGSTQPEVSSAGGDGLWLVRHVCDEVRIRSRPGSTSVRIYFTVS